MTRLAVTVVAAIIGAAIWAHAATHRTATKWNTRGPR